MQPVIEKLLVDNALDETKLAEGEEIAEGAGLPLFRVLLHLKLVDAKAAAKAMSATTGRAILNLDRYALPPTPVANFPVGLCRELRVLPLVFEPGEEGEQLVVAMSDPTDENAGQRVASLVRCNVRPVLVDDAALARAIANRYEPPEVLLLEEASAEFDIDIATESRIQKLDRDGHKHDKTEESEPSGDSSELPDSLLPTRPTLKRPPSGGDVFENFSDAPAERTVIMRAPPADDRTKVLRNPFLDPSSLSGATEMTSVIGQARVCFVSRDAKARLRVAADLAPVIRDAIVLDDLKRAVDMTEGDPPDEVVIHGPKNDAGTGVLLERIARAVGQGIVVISNDESFAELPCVRRRIPLPMKAAEIAPLILDGLLAPNDE